MSSPTITRTSLVDDDGTGTTGTVINDALKQSLYDQIDGALALTVPLAGLTPTAFTNADASPDVSANVVFTCGYTTTTTITGFDGASSGKVITVVFAPTGGATVTVNRDTCYLSGGSTFSVASGVLATLTLVKVGSKWHEVSRTNPES